VPSAELKPAAPKAAPTLARSVAQSHWALFFTTLCVGTVIIAAGVALGAALTAQDTCATFQATEVAAGRRFGWAAELPCAQDGAALRTCDLGTLFTYTCPAPTAADIAWITTPPALCTTPGTPSAPSPNAGTNCPIYGGIDDTSAQCESFACATALFLSRRTNPATAQPFSAGLTSDTSAAFTATFRLLKGSTTAAATGVTSFVSASPFSATPFTLRDYAYPLEGNTDTATYANFQLVSMTN
jgi:hypothetical protein